MFNRRRFLETLSGVPLIGGFFAAGTSSCSVGVETSRDYFKELGVRTFINAAGTYTALTASLMQKETLDAIQYASRYFVSLEELQEKVGARIARLLDCDAAMVTAGAASALTLGTAAVLTGKEKEKIVRLPDLTGMKSEVIIQKTHRFGYDHAVRNCGIRLIEVESRQELAEAVNEKTAMMLFLNDNNDVGPIQDIEFVELGKKYGIPTFNDCAADVPPLENLYKYTRMGFDLVTFSGGKGLRGPQSTGLLIGRRDLIEAARLNTTPHSDTIGRGMKVNKEELLGLLAALELYIGKDHASERLEWERRAELIRKSATSIPGVEAEIYVPPIANHVPHIRISWGNSSVPLTPEQASEELRHGDPSIEVKQDETALLVGVWMMQPGEAEVVARRISEVLQS